jgi:2'-5' RNA ligase
VSSKRLFFALWPDDRQRDRMRDFISPVARLVEGRAVERRNWHITLAYIGDFPEGRVDELLDAKNALQMESFRLRFDRLEFWPRPKIAALVPPTIPPELEQLVDDLQGLVLAAGVNPEHQRVYRPHVTVVHNARTFETQRLAQSALLEWSSFELVESISAPGGTTYHPIVKDF